ncbi:MAG: response regulator transcription factor [Aeromicrobium sp.]
MRVLIVEDEPHLSRALSINLKARNYQVSTAMTGAAALDMAPDHPDLMILDLGLPDMEGLDVIRAFRLSSSAPIIVLSARTDRRDKVDALDAGADDYLTKPFGMDELLARMRAAIRRSEPASETRPIIETSHFTIDVAAKQVTTAEGTVRLTPTEWDILELLIRNRGKLVSQKHILQEVWGPTYVNETHYLRVYLAQLRRKLEPDPARPQFLLTEPGMGYRFDAP